MPEDAIAASSDVRFSERLDIGGYRRTARVVDEDLRGGNVLGVGVSDFEVVDGDSGCDSSDRRDRGGATVDLKKLVSLMQVTCQGPAVVGALFPGSPLSEASGQKIGRMRPPSSLTQRCHYSPQPW
jgi:hypothetical protein